MNSLRVLVADDHAVLREGLAMLIAAQPDMGVVAQARGGREAAQLAQRLQPDVVVLDVSMPDMDGAAAAEQIRADSPASHVLAPANPKWIHTSEEPVRRRAELTEREEQVLRLIAWGQSNKEVGTKLGISVKTVESYKATALDKLRLRSRTDILRYALAQKWLSEDADPE